MSLNPTIEARARLATRVLDQPSILLVDDNPEKRFALRAVLTPLGVPVVEADSGFAALRCVMVHDFAVILLDVRMPIMDGFETAALIRHRQQSELTPIIFITAFRSDEVRDAGHYAEGAVDFIEAPVDPEELRAKVTVFVNLFTKAALLASHAGEVQTLADQLRLLTDAAPIGIFQTDATNRYVYTNPRWSQMMGIGPDEALGSRWQLPLASDRFAVQHPVLDGMGEPQPEISRHIEIHRKGVPPRTLLITAASIPDPAGEMAGWVGTITDVTAEAEAEAAASHFRAVVESSRDAIVSKDLDGIVTSWNAGAQHLYGYSPDEMLGASISVLIPEGHDDDMSETLSRVRSGEQVDNYETIRVRKDGTPVHVSLTTSPILGPGGHAVGASVISRDISDRRKAEQLKDEFLALVSHELRTPLSSIVAHVELLLDNESLGEDRRRHFIEVIDRNSARLERLVGDLLFVAQLESANLSLSMTDVDIVAVATEAVEAATPVAQQAGVIATLVSEESSLVVRADPGRLGQAIDNLVSNAIKYSPEGGAVVVRVLRTSDASVIEIEDRGMGIAREEQGRIFDRFFRASSAVDLQIQGVGLGLSIVKRIIDGHGGQVELVSEPGAGAMFRIILPVVSGPLALAGARPAVTVPPSIGEKP